MTTAIATRSKNELSKLPSLAEIGGTQLATTVIDTLTKSGDYLDRIQLFQGTSALAKEDKIKAGHYGVPKGEDVEVLGPSIDLLVFAAKPKALDTSGDTPVAAHDPESAEFKRIKERAETEKDSGCMYGLEFLVFERNSGKFYTYFANSASARREAGKMIPNKEILAVTLGATFVKKRQYSWHAPTVTKCSTDFANFPAIDKIRAEVEKFSKPDENGAEEVEATDAPAKNRRAR
jgi:hypothetical protein